jgi:hypothetical protein
MPRLRGGSSVRSAPSSTRNSTDWCAVGIVDPFEDQYQKPVPTSESGHEAESERVLEASNGAAQESNLPSDGLRRLTGFEDRLGHRARAAPGPA